MQSVHEIYKNNVLPLSEIERLKMIELIVKDISNQSRPSDNGKSKPFGWWQGREITEEEYNKLSHNEQIDFDLAMSYLDTHEDQ